VVEYQIDQFNPLGLTECIPIDGSFSSAIGPKVLESKLCRVVEDILELRLFGDLKDE
jgi:hypothetical protein